MGKEKKNRNKKLRSLILLLLLTIVMFGTSTYAWFTANRVVTINSLDVNVDASNGIQISTNGASWKSVITKADITTGYTGSVNQLPSSVTAVSSDCVPTSAGRINMFSSIIGNDSITGNYTIKTVQETDTAGTSGKYIVFDIFLRVDNDQTIYMTGESDVEFLDDEDRGLKNATRVAFINLGHEDSDASANDITSLNAGTSSEIIIWEPNSNAHTTIVSSSVAPDYGVTLTEITAIPDGESEPVGTGYFQPVSYRGIASEFSSPKDLKQIVNGTLYEEGNVTYTSAVTPTIRTLEDNVEMKEFADLEAGVTKFRVYMWIEGQDIDCENNATGSNIAFKVQFTTEEPASTQQEASSQQP